MLLRYPFQKLCILPTAEAHHQFVLAASGPTINCISFADGRLLHQWPSQHVDNGDDVHEDGNEGNRPIKKRKLDSNGHDPISRQQSEASDASLEIVAERKKGERKKSKFIDTKLPNVSHLLVTSDGMYAIAVTAEDKAVRVFQIQYDGSLRQLSQRSLPKKLCAICLTKDEKTILAADKFGDVYAVPLHQSEGWTGRERKQEESIFKPSASALTVHTKGNLEALRQQQEQKMSAPKRDGPDFECQLILGHVSLLTDLAVAEGKVDGKWRSFILTSDRDEHIRVSRGMPQAHIIENFCLGHCDFVTRLCISPSKPELLIAGNGEGSLRLFDWQAGRLAESIPLASFLSNSKDVNLELPEGRSYERLAVSGIWPINFSNDADKSGADESFIMVAMEGLPIVLSFVLGKDGLEKLQSIILKGNVLDVAVVQSARQVLVSIDNVHEPCSMKSYRALSSANEAPLQSFKLHVDETAVAAKEKFIWEPTGLPFDYSNIRQALHSAPEPIVEDNTKSKTYEKTFSALGEFLYGLENLRKKKGASAEELLEAEVDGVGSMPLEEPEEE